MKTKGKNPTKVNIVTLGCSKNLVDSEVLLTQLKGNNVAATHEATNDDANVIVINTCGFVEKAKQESIDTILRYADAKTSGQIKKLYVTGCLSQRYKDELALEIPEVDAWFGTMELPALLKRFKATYRHDLLGERLTTTSKHYAYLKISEGCDRPCSFCAIPLMRGKHVSKPMEQIVLEAQNLVKNGVKEIILIAQDLTYYGIDIYRKRQLADLLLRLSDLEGLAWIRLHYAYPASFPFEILPIIRERSNICNYLDIPLQTGSNAMLKAMRRGITRAKTEALIETIRQEIPSIALRTTLIAGHPNESEADHEETLRFVEKMRFDRLGVFTYSHEENTHAFTMPDNVPEEVKQERAADIMSLQENISLVINQSKVGKIYSVLFDRKESGFWIGRTEADSPEVDNEVLVSAENYVRLGDFAQVKIKEVQAFDLYGDLC